MDDERIAELVDFYALDSWQGTNTLENNLFIWKYALSDKQFPGWEADHIDQETNLDGQLSSDSIWYPMDNEGERLLNVVVHERASRAEAHHFLIEQLSRFHGPRLLRLENINTGDVAFGVPGGYLILFARANLTVMIRNADRDLISVFEIAHQFDQDLCRRPAILEKGVNPEIEHFTSPTSNVAMGSNALLDIEATDPLGRPLWFKFFSELGEVKFEARQLVYQPISPGEERITAYAINPNGGTDTHELQFTVG